MAELKQIRQRFQTKGITVTQTLTRDGDTVSADPHMLAQVVRNLLENAWRYTPPGGRVHIETLLDPDALQLVFSNTADRFDPGALPFLFERFYRGERSRSREHGGAGIGLAIVKELVEAHEGTVAAEYDNKVFYIRISLPLALPKL
jgi:signal transduction histidine kinase